MGELVSLVCKKKKKSHSRMVKERFELIIVALGELAQVSKHRKRMK